MLKLVTLFLCNKFLLSDIILGYSYNVMSLALVLALGLALALE